MSELTRPVRVGDRERGHTDELLRAALADGVLTLTEYDERAARCWAARTRGELDEVVDDLPGVAPPRPAGTPTDGPLRVIAVLSEDALHAPVAPGQRVDAVAVMGTAVVDLRREDLPAETTVRAVCVMGEVKVHVPPGTTVHLSGGAVLGERKAKVGPPRAGGPVVHLDARAVMGTVQVDDRPRKGGLLPAAGRGPLPQPRASTQAADSPAVRRRSRRLARAAGAALPLALTGGLLLAGYQVVSSDQTVVFGSSETVVVPGVDAEDGTWRAGMLFGSVRVVVPDDVRVRTTGWVVFGSTSCEAACRSTSDLLVEVRGTGAFGSLQVLTESEAAAEDDPDD